MSTSGSMSVSQRFSGFQRVLNPFERFPFAAQLQKRFALEVEQMLFADQRLVGQRPARQYVCQCSSDQRVVIADAAGAPREMYAEFERGQDALAADAHAGSRH